MADAGYGYWEMIKSGSDMTAQVMRQVNRALKPALTNVIFFLFFNSVLFVYFVIFRLTIVGENELG